MVVGVKPTIRSNLSAVADLNSSKERREVAALLNVAVVTNADDAAFARIDERVTIKVNIVAEFNRTTPMTLDDCVIISEEDMAAEPDSVVVCRRTGSEVAPHIHIGQVDTTESGRGEHRRQTSGEPTRRTSAGELHPKP